MLKIINFLFENVLYEFANSVGGAVFFKFYRSFLLFGGFFGKQMHSPECGSYDLT